MGGAVPPLTYTSSWRSIWLGPGQLYHTQPPIQWVPWALSLGVKWPGCEADHSPPSSADVKNAWSYNSTPTIRLHGVVLRDNFTFTHKIAIQLHLVAESFTIYSSCSRRPVRKLLDVPSYVCTVDSNSHASPSLINKSQIPRGLIWPLTQGLSLGCLCADHKTNRWIRHSLVFTA
jgi:hypothetical protein